MAGELSAHFATGQVLYARLFDLATGLVWDGADFVAPDDADWADYVIAMDEDADSGDYRGDMPAVGAGYYQYLTHLQLGGFEAAGDPVVWTGEVQWDGSAVLPLSSIPAAIQSLLGGANLTLESAMRESGDFTILSGDDYHVDDGRALRWTYEDAVIDYTDNASVLALGRPDETTLEFDADISKSGNTVTVLVPLTAAESATIREGMPWSFQVHTTLNTNRVITKIKGNASAEEWIGL